MFQKKSLHIFILFLLFSCQSKVSDRHELPLQGDWRGVLHTQEVEIPFHFNILYSPDEEIQITLINGKEEIPITNARFEGDTLHIPMHIFDADIMAAFHEREMNGYWRKNYAEGYRIPFTASYGQAFRFLQHPEEPEVDITGRWEVYFESSTGKKLAIGEFEQEGNQVSGTFLRPAGDYRYMVGEIGRRNFYLSTFDGEHAYLFHGTVRDDTIKGDFYSGKSRHEKWSAFRNETVELPDRQKLSFLKEGYESLEFNLPDMNGNYINLNDPLFKGKTVIVQIFGTWCPNCMDETKFLSDWYRRNKDRGVEIVAIAFEKKNDYEYARSRIEKLKKRFDIKYNFLFGGKSDRSSTAEVLPMLEGTVSFPTTIFIDRTGKVRKIHTGFSGPGTGEHYTEFVKEFNEFMDELIDE